MRRSSPGVSRLVGDSESATGHPSARALNSEPLRQSGLIVVPAGVRAAEVEAGAAVGVVVVLRERRRDSWERTSQRVSLGGWKPCEQHAQALAQQHPR